jgi:hypothetical protein
MDNVPQFVVFNSWSTSFLRNTENDKLSRLYHLQAHINDQNSIQHVICCHRFVHNPFIDLPRRRHPVYDQSANILKWQMAELLRIYQALVYLPPLQIYNLLQKWN